VAFSAFGAQARCEFQASRRCLCEPSAATVFVVAQPAARAVEARRRASKKRRDSFMRDESEASNCQATIRSHRATADIFPASGRAGA
jgi:hypothetical protein